LSLAAVVVAVDIQIPDPVAAGGKITISWSPDPTLQTFSMFLTHTSFASPFFAAPSSRSTS
jgi:hypothetical protein